MSETHYRPNIPIPTDTKELVEQLSLIRKKFANTGITYIEITKKSSELEKDVALIEALLSNKVNKVMKLIDLGARINEKSGLICLRHSARNNHLEIAIWLMDHGINPNKDRYILRDAVFAGHKKMISLLWNYE